MHFDPDQMLHRVSRWTTSGESFVEGDNDFDRRYEAMERQIAVLGAYADLILARCSMSSSAESGNQVQVPNTALEQIAQVTRWCWEHYFVAGEKSREDLRFRLCELFDALVETGGAVTLANVLSKIARPLLALTLRVAPPDPIDRYGLARFPNPTHTVCRLPARNYVTRAARKTDTFRVTITAPCSAPRRHRSGRGT